MALLIVLVPSLLFGIEIEQKHRVRNPGPYCVFTSLETLGNVHGIKETKGMVAKLKEEWPLGVPGYEELVRGKLQSLGVKHVYQSFGNKDVAILKYADTHGVVVAIGPGNPHSQGCHAIVLISCDDKRIRFYDSNFPKDIWVADRAFFNRWWTGGGAALLPE
jgi:hypothetical protein